MAFRQFFKLFIVLAFYCTSFLSHSAESNCLDAFSSIRPLSSYSLPLQQLVRKSDIGIGEEALIKTLSKGAEASVHLVAKKNQSGEIFLFLRKRYKNPMKARRNLRLFQKLQSLEERGQLPGFRVAKPAMQKENILEMEYVEGIPINSLRPGVNPGHIGIYNRFRNAFYNVFSLWEKRVKHLKGELPPPVEKIIEQQENAGRLWKQMLSKNNTDDVISSWLLVERLSRGRHTALYQLKAENIIVENFTREFVIVDPM